VVLQIVASIGLLLDMVGAILLFRYGLPEQVRRGGNALRVRTEPSAEAPDAPREPSRQDQLGSLGLVLLIGGFALQLLGELLHLGPGH
jgi:hypothetical protein